MLFSISTLSQIPHLSHHMFPIVFIGFLRGVSATEVGAGEPQGVFESSGEGGIGNVEDYYTLNPKP